MTWDASGLKDFQRRTVDYVSERMIEDGQRRFLVADEVGLGKTLVARGVMATLVEHLRERGARRVNVVYICSNQEIARQNMKRLRIPGIADTALPSRLTLLPLHLKRFAPRGVNLVSLTPGTSFEPHSRSGWIQERALLMHLLTPVWGIPRHRGVYEVFRVKASRASLERDLGFVGAPDEMIARTFSRAMARSRLRKEFFELAECGRRRELREEERTRQLALIGELRRALAQCSIAALKPDLVILDEFQRFSDLLDGQTEAAELAQQLFSFTNARRESARVLLLSATPYKPYSHAAEDGATHQAELGRLLRFLYADETRAETVELQFAALRDELLGVGDDEQRLIEARHQLQGSLTEVITRTERLASSASRNGMLTERDPPAFELAAEDVRHWQDLANLHRLLRDRELLTNAAPIAEFWKSAPWLAQFMDAYVLKRAISEARAIDGKKDPELAAALRSVARQLNWRRFESYQPIEPPNPRMRSLQADTTERAWDLLWLPPSMPYHLPGPPYDRPSSENLSKRLVFSSWDVVPRVIAGFLSYEAERRAVTAHGAAASNTATARKAHDRRLLDFKLERQEGGDQRPASMTTLALLSPSTALAELGDPLTTARELGTRGPPPVHSVLQSVRERIAQRLADIRVTADNRLPGPDPRWYWAAPLLLDRQRNEAREFWDIPGLAWHWSERSVAGIENFSQHVREAQRVYDEGISLGRRPDDLEEVLALLALGGPANVALRGIQRNLPEVASPDALIAAARLGWGFRQHLNTPEAIAIITHAVQGRAYWLQALRYSLHGNLQSVVDEWMHVLADDAGAGRESPADVLDETVRRMVLTLGLGTSGVKVDTLGSRGKRTWRTHFAMRYGQAKDEGSEQSVHPEAVRAAFNSPLRPFVLASTSVGQEGLDFHTYCHAVVHWNLPTNPVDLEQREGRVHRYKGHAVRRNVAEAFGPSAVSGTSADPWKTAFDAARDARPADQDDLVPYWLYPGSAEIERYVPALPYSRDAERLTRVLRALTLYRMVLGQPRQDDLIAYLQEHVGQAGAERLAELARVDLSPRPAVLTTPVTSIA